MQTETQIWENQVYSSRVPVIYGPQVVKFSTKAFFIRRFLKLVKTDRVLDVGCGLGEYSFFAAAHAGNVIGLDAAPTAIAAAREAAARLAISNVEFRLGSAYELPEALEDQLPFDKAICFDLLEHLSEPEKVLRQLHALLRPGGRALLFTNCYGKFSWAFLKEWFLRRGRVEPLWESDKRDHHLIRFTPERLHKMTAEWRGMFIYKNHFLIPAMGWLTARLDRLWQKRRAGENPPTNLPFAESNGKVQLQVEVNRPRRLVQAATLAVSVLEMETIGRLLPGAGVYLLLEKR